MLHMSMCGCSPAVQRHTFSFQVPIPLCHPPILGSRGRVPPAADFCLSSVTAAYQIWGASQRPHGTVFVACNLKGVVASRPTVSSVNKLPFDCTVLPLHTLRERRRLYLYLQCACTIPFFTLKVERNSTLPCFNIQGALVQALRK